MLSKFISLSSETINSCYFWFGYLLWIAFKIYIFVIGNNAQQSNADECVLWIAFKIYIFVIGNNSWFYNILFNIVVNCFQNLYLCHRKQFSDAIRQIHYSCELLSKFISLSSETIIQNKVVPLYRLWIAFKIYIFVIGNNILKKINGDRSVVNCFQNLYLCHRKQLIDNEEWIELRCELLSKFISLSSETIMSKKKRPLCMLWIAFKIYIFVIGNNKFFLTFYLSRVVNCFQNLYLCHRKQYLGNVAIFRESCELLSKFISLSSETIRTSCRYYWQ